MAAGDIFNKTVETVAASGYFNMQPAGGMEVIIHNVNHSGDADLEFYDGSDFIKIDSQTGFGTWMGMFLHCTNTRYYRVKNTAAVDAKFACDGVVSKG